MRFQKALTVLSVAMLLLAQSASAAPQCLVRAHPSPAVSDPAAAGYAAALAGGACVTTIAYADAADLAAKVAAAGDVVVTGVAGDAALAAARAASASAVFVGAQTQSAAARGYDSHVYYTGADPVSEVVALFSYVQPSRAAVMLVAHTGMDAVAAAASDMTGSAATVYAAASADAADVDEAQYAAVVAARPSAIVVAGPSGAQASAFFRRIVQEPSVIASGAAVVAPAAMQVSLVAAYAEAVGSGAAVVPASRIVFSTTTPVASDARYEAVAAFKTDMGAAAASLNTAEQTAAMAGWVAGKVAQQVVARYGASGSGVASGMAGQNRFVVSDLVIGDYAGACSANMRGVACDCNQGGRTIYISTATVAADGSIDIAPVTGADHTYPLSTCYGPKVLLATPATHPGRAIFRITEGETEAITRGSTCKPSRALIILLICIAFIMICVPLLGYLAWALWKTFSGREKKSSST